VMVVFATRKWLYRYNCNPEEGGLSGIVLNCNPEVL
jgi:hypothetical protein